jgi:DinB superfamily
MSMNNSDRERVLTGLASSEARLLGLVAGLTAEQWAFRERANSHGARWSIAEIFEHLAVFERFILGRVCAAIDAPADAERCVAAAGFAERNEGLVLGLAASRETRFTAREVNQPQGRWTDPVELVAEFQAARAETVRFVEGCSADLRGALFAHVAFGDLDGVQWLLLLGTHADRHAMQIREVMADEGFPG